LKIKCVKFHQNRSKTVDLYTKQTFKQRSNLGRFYGTLATLATTRKAMEGRTKPTYVVIGRSGLSIYPIYIFSLWVYRARGTGSLVPIPDKKLVVPREKLERQMLFFSPLMTTVEVVYLKNYIYREPINILEELNDQIHEYA
jgi:hypothetical protein